MRKAGQLAEVPEATALLVVAERAIHRAPWHHTTDPGHMVHVLRCLRRLLQCHLRSRRVLGSACGGTATPLNRMSRPGHHDTLHSDVVLSPEGQQLSQEPNGIADGITGARQAGVPLLPYLAVQPSEVVAAMGEGRQEQQQQQQRWPDSSAPAGAHTSDPTNTALARLGGLLRAAGPRDG